MGCAIVVARACFSNEIGVSHHIAGGVFVRVGTLRVFVAPAGAQAGQTQQQAQQ